jgi:hypothetical protein
MNRKIYITFICLLSFQFLFAAKDSVYSFRFINDITITIDYPQNYSANKKTQLILFALPNGNTTAQAMGKQMQANDDWHYDIQHIAAQTKFIRNKLTKENIVIIYLENDYKSWPLWKTKHEDYLKIVRSIMDTIPKAIHTAKFYYHLNGHSGGGSFIFAYLKSVSKIPSKIKRITFLDSDYNYDSTYTSKLGHWLAQSSSRHLTVFAYNDSVVIYNGKPLVSPTGGTWYRSKLMMKELAFDYAITRSDSVVQYSAVNNRINFFLIDNPQGKIFHTVQVERNGFIHSVLIGTKKENDGYLYWGERAYKNFIQ